MQYRKEITLPDGRVCVIRTAEASDAEEMLRHRGVTTRETDFLLSYPDELPDEEGEARFLAAVSASPRAVQLGAFVGGSLIATAGIMPVGRQAKCRHRAEFGVSVEKAYWRQGIGRALTAACLDCAKSAGYLQVELEVVDGNTRAMAMYESFGFVRCGENPRAFLTRDGRWQTLITMRLPLEGEV